MTQPFVAVPVLSVGLPSPQPRIREQAARKLAQDAGAPATPTEAVGGPTRRGRPEEPALVSARDARDAPDAPSAPDVSDPLGAVAERSQLGPLARFAVAGVTDLFVNGSRGLWADRGDGARRVPDWHCEERALRELAVRLIALGGRHIDEATPCVDVRLADGVRVHAVLPPISSTGTLLSVRLPAVERHSLAKLEAAGMFPGNSLALLRAAVAARENVLITGAGGSGKTTLLAALLAEAPAHERILVIEDVAELRIDHPHVVGLESRQANLEGAGELGLVRLVREALRMRPDRLVLGECRGAEVRELLAALNTGHDGGAGTLHANSLDDVPARIEALGALAAMTPEAIARQAVSAIDRVVHLERVAGVRRIERIGRFALDTNDRLRVITGAGIAGEEDA